MLCVCAFLCLVTLAEGLPLQPGRIFPEYKSSTLQLSVARRDLGGATVTVGSEEQAVFAGGCTLKGIGPSTPFICDKASAVVDVVSPKGTVRQGPPLSEARGWVATCSSPGSNMVAMAGGGTSGTGHHSRVGDVITFDTDGGMHMQSSSTALSEGRWGIACAAAGGNVYFMGGKVVVDG